MPNTFEFATFELFLLAWFEICYFKRQVPTLHSSAPPAEDEEEKKRRIKILLEQSETTTTMSKIDQICSKVTTRLTPVQFEKIIVVFRSFVVCFVFVN